MIALSRESPEIIFFFSYDFKTRKIPNFTEHYALKHKLKTHCYTHY